MVDAMNCQIICYRLMFIFCQSFFLKPHYILESCILMSCCGHCIWWLKGRLHIKVKAVTEQSVFFTISGCCTTLLRKEIPEFLSWEAYAYAVLYDV